MPFNHRRIVAADMLFGLLVIAWPAWPMQVSTEPRAVDPDSLYALRESPGQAAQAESIWAERLALDPKDFESAWKLARARYWLGGHAPKSERKALLEAGVAAGRTAVALHADRPEGYFWFAANMGALAESFGLRQGIKYRGAVKDALLTVLQLDPAYQQGSADRALGRWYYKVPGLFGGSKSKSEEHLRRSLAYAPQSTASLFFLAETLLERDRTDEAGAALRGVIDAPLDPEWGPEDREFKELARQELERLPAISITSPAPDRAAEPEAVLSNSFGLVESTLPW